MSENDNPKTNPLKKYLPDLGLLKRKWKSPAKPPEADDPLSQDNRANGYLPATPPKASSATRARTVRFRLKIVLYPFIFLILLLAAAGVALEYYFPREQVRALAQRELTELLKVPVAIGKLDFSLLKGIQITNATVGENPPIVQVQSLVLDYSLAKLALGRFTINRLLVEQPRINLVSHDGVWNFQPLLELGKAAKPETPKAKKPIEELRLPINLDLKRFAINNVVFNLNADGPLPMGETLAAHLEGLSLSAEGHAGPSGADGPLPIEATLHVIMGPGAGGAANGPLPEAHNIAFKSTQDKDIDIKTLALADLTLTAKGLNRITASGSIRLRNNSIKVGKTLPSPDVGIDLKIAASPKEQNLQIERLALNLAEDNKISVSAEARHYLADVDGPLPPEFRFSIDTAALDIAKLLEWGKSVLPDLPVTAAGNIGIEHLQIAGNLKNNPPETLHVESGSLTVENLSVSHDKLGAVLEKGRIAVNIQGVELVNLVPRELAATVDMQIAKAGFGNINARNVKTHLQISGEDPALEKSRLEMSAAIDTLDFSHPAWGKIRTGLQLKGSAEGNFAKGDFQSVNLDLRGEDWATWLVKAQAREFGIDDFKVDQTLSLHVNKLQATLPKEALKKLQLTEIGGSVKIHTAVEGKLDTAYRPLQATAKTDIDLSGITARSDSLAFNVKGASVKGGFSALFDADGPLPAANGVKISALQVDTAFQSVQTPKGLEIGPTSVRSTLSMDKFYSLSGKGGAVPVAYRVALQSGGIRSGEPAAAIAKVSLDGDLRADLLPSGADGPLPDVRNINLNGEIVAGKLAGLSRFAVEKIKTVFAVNASDHTLTQTRVDLKTSVVSPSFKDGDMTISLKEAALEANTRQNLRNGNIDIKQIRLTIPSVMNFETQGHLENWGKTFSVQSKLDKLSFAELWKSLPETAKKRLRGAPFTGTAAFDLAGKGRLPENFSKTSFNLPVDVQGKFVLNNVTLAIPSLEMQTQNLSGVAEITYKNGKGDIVGNVNIGSLQKQDMKIAGGAGLKLHVEGELPTPQALKNLDIPIQLQGDLGLKNFSVIWPSQNIEVADLNHSLKLRLRNNNAVVSGRIDIAKLFKRDILGDAWLDPQFAFGYSLAGWNKLSIDKQELTLKNRGATLFLTGRVDGLKPFLSGKQAPTPANLVKRLDIVLDTVADLKAEQAVGLTKTIKANGTLNSRLSLRLEGGKNVELDGEVGFGKFNVASAPSLKVENIDGKFLFNKKLTLEKKAPTASADTVATSQRGYFDQLRDFSPYKNILKIGSIQFDQYLASRIGLDIFYRDNQLRMEKFLFDALNGSVAGNLVLEQTRTGPRFNYFVEFAGLDFQKPTGGKLARKDAQTEIDGNIQIGFKIDQGAANEKITLDRLDLKIFITRIGEEALDRILLFLDPEESKPAIVDTRLKLKLATPHQLKLILENGNLSVDVWLKSKMLGGVVKMPGLKRVAVGNLKQFQKINEQLQALSDLKNILQYLAAQGIAFDPEKGAVTLF